MSNGVTRETAESKGVRSTRRTARWWQLGAVLLAGGLVAAACGSSSTADKKSTTTTKPKTKSTTTTTAAPTTTTAPVVTTTTAKPASGAAVVVPTTPRTVTPTTAAPATGGAPGGSLSANTSTPAAALTGAGSTFDQPLFARQFYYYNQANRGVTVNYAAVGSGTGESDILAGSVNFGASDVPEPPGTTGTGGAILQVPVVLGGVAIAYNLPGTGSGLQLTGAQIAKIYAGTITSWSQIPGSGSTANIITVHRSDSSGTSNAFTSFLNSVDPGDWPTSLVGKSPAWPGSGSLGGNGNAGVAGDVQSTPNSIGYVELAYVLQSGLTYASVQNAAGGYIAPNLNSVAAAAAAFPNVSAGTPLIVNPPASAASAYPISTYSWAIVFQKQANTNNGIALGKLLDWMVTTGQGQASAIGYAPLPGNVVSLAESTIKQMQTSAGQPLFS